MRQSFCHSFTRIDFEKPVKWCMIVDVKGSSKDT